LPHITYTDQQRRDIVEQALELLADRTPGAYQTVATLNATTVSTVRRWVKAHQATARPLTSGPMLASPVGRDLSQSHPLRTIARCGWCRQPLQAWWDDANQPGYHCQPTCRRSVPVLARDLHAAVLAAVRRSAPRHGTDITAVPRVLARVTVAATPTAITLTWRTPPPPPPAAADGHERPGGAEPENAHREPNR
jgi:transposase-like protein